MEHVCRDLAAADRCHGSDLEGTLKVSFGLAPVLSGFEQRQGA